MVFGGENYARKARVFGDSDPLSGVELGGVEDRGVDVAGAPLGIREGVGSEVEEHCHVAELPLELRGRGEGQNGKRRWLSGCLGRRKGGSERE